jgi:hypothetical protein
MQQFWQYLGTIENPISFEICVKSCFQAFKTLTEKMFQTFKGKEEEKLLSLKKYISIEILRTLFITVVMLIRRMMAQKLLVRLKYTK